MNCPLLALSITGRPASIFSASHCWLLLNCASPRNASVTRLAVSTSVTSRKRSPGCSNHSRLVAPSLTTGVAASGKAANSGASAARALEAGYSQQNQIVVGGNGDFGEDGIFFQLGQLRVAQAAALNPREAALATEYAQVAPHLAFGITVGGKQMLGIGEMTHIGGNLPLQIFFAVRPANCRQRPVIRGSSALTADERKRKADAEEKV